MDKKIIFKRMRHNIFFMTGSILLVLLIVVIVIVPLFMDFNPVKQDLASRLLPPEWLSKGLKGHILGTDQIGRDVFMRLLLGGRISLIIASTVVLLQSTIGVCLGMLAGYYGGKVDAIIMRACDVVLAVPVLIFSIALIAVLGKSISVLIFVLVINNWVSSAKIVRNDMMVYRNKEFVRASKLFGAGNAHIMIKQIFPNVTTNLIVLMSQALGGVLLIESTLSFMNLGIQAPRPSWGNMIAVGRNYLITEPWLAIAPGVALMLIVLCFHFLGDGLRDVLDPKENRRKLGRRTINKAKWVKAADDAQQ